MMAKAGATGADCVGCKYFVTYERSFAPGVCSKKGIAGLDIDAGVLDAAGRKKLLLNGGSVCCKIYKRELIFDYPERFPEGCFFEDNCVMPLIYSRVKHFEFVNEPLYYYYQRANATTKGLDVKKYTDRLNSARTIVKYARQYGYFEPNKDEIEALFIRIFYVNTFWGMVKFFPFSRFWRREFKSMTSEIKQEFPEYLKNPYWRREFGRKRHIICSIASVFPSLVWVVLSLRFWLCRVLKK